MGDFSLVGGIGSIEAIGIDSANTRGTQIQSSGTANTKGAWTELSASTSFESSKIIIVSTVEITSTNGSSIFLDLAVGGAGSEVTIADNLLYSQVSQTSSKVAVFPLPINIAIGSRVSVRIQSNKATRRSAVMAYLVPKSFSGGSGAGVLVSYGLTIANTSGTLIDPSGTANTKGAWTEISASTTKNHKGIIIAVGSNENSGQVQHAMLLDVSVGASGSESVIISDVPMGMNTVEQYSSMQQFYGVSISSGERLSVRAQSSITDATDRLFDIALYGVS